MHALSLIPNSRFKFFPQLNDLNNTKWLHSTGRFTEGVTDIHFTSDSLQDTLLREIAKEKMIPVKEVLEAFELFARIRKVVRSEFVVDLFCGHGLLGLLFAIFERKVERVLMIDMKKPASQQKLLDIAARVAPWSVDKIETRKAMITTEDDWLELGCAIVSSHACGVLTDMCIDIAIKCDGPVAILPCCYPRKGCPAPQAIHMAVGLEMAFDIHRTYRLEQAGYQVRWSVIPEEITPMNRVIMGWKKKENK